MMDRDIEKERLLIAAANLTDIADCLLKEAVQLTEYLRAVTITVISRWCNDAMIAPFFLEHYKWADEIIILLSSDTTDDTREIISKYENARVVEFEYESGTFNVMEASKAIHAETRKVTTDWLIAVDADEFVFVDDFSDVRYFLSKVVGNVVYVDFYNVYKHRSELPLDPTIPAVFMRRHGDPDREANNGRYKKPVIVRTRIKFTWSLGMHSIEPSTRIKVSKPRLIGSHWRMADVSLAISRRMRGRRENLLQKDIDNQWSCDNFDVTIDEIRKECEQHLDDPQVF